MQVAFYAKGVKSAVAMPEQPPLGVTYIQGYDQGSTAYPILAIARDPRIGGYTVPADYTAHPDATKWPDHVFVGVSQTNADNRVLHLYMKLPGALVSDDVFNDELRVNVTSYTRMDRATVALPIVGATDGTASTPVSNSIVALTVNDPGSGYITIPTLAISAPNGGGTQATATVTNLKAVSAAVSAPGSGYTFGDTLTGSTGTGTKATFTVAGGEMDSLSVTATGQNYVIGDVLTLAGGIFATPATITVSTLGLSATSLNAKGTGYVPGETITLAGGTFSSPAIITISNTQLATVVGIAAGGSGGTDGTRTAQGTTGTGVKFTVSVTVSGGAITAVGAILTAGSYDVNPSVLTAEPVTGTGIPTGAQLNITMGVRGQTVTTRGSYTVTTSAFTQSATSGSGSGATFSGALWGVSTFVITAPGQYSAPAASSFTVGSTTSTSGTGATFGSATYTINQLTVATGGAYTVVATNPDSLTGGTGTGLTAVLDFGIGAVALGTAGTTYYYPPTITPSYGSASISATMSAPQALSSQTAYYTAAARLKTELAAVKKHTWSSMPLPPTRVEYHSKSYPLPDIFTYISPWTVPGYEGFYARPPFPGVNYTTIANGVSTNPARVVISYSNGPSGSVPATWRVITPGVQSRIFPIGQNTIHNAIIQAETGPSGTLINEITPASTPASYIRGQTLIIDASERPSVGNFYEKRVMTIT